MKRILAAALLSLAIAAATFAEGISLGGLGGGLQFGGGAGGSSSSGKSDNSGNTVLGAKASIGLSDGVGFIAFVQKSWEKFTVQAEVALMEDDGEAEGEVYGYDYYGYYSYYNEHYDASYTDFALLLGRKYGQKSMYLNPYVGARHGIVDCDSGDSDVNPHSSFALLLGCQGFIGPFVLEGRYAIELADSDVRPSKLYLNAGLAFRF